MSIRRVVVAGGTHGDELTGVEIVRHIPAEEITRPSFTTELLLSNMAAVEAGCRFIDTDLNRAFGAVEPSGAEGKLAHELKETLKGTDFLIDFHNTTANCGVMMIASDSSDLFTMQLFAALQAKLPKSMPLQFFLVETKEGQCPIANIGSVARHDIGIELGPQAHGTLKTETYAQARHLLREILDFVEEFNGGKEYEATTLQVCRLVKSVKYPVDKDGGISAMVHEQVQDYVPLIAGSPAFVTFDGEEIPWAAEDGDCVPIFVQESAYRSQQVAFTQTVSDIVQVGALSGARPIKRAKKQERG
jgi:succinylglutamate desuccinylase